MQQWPVILRRINRYRYKIKKKKKDCLRSLMKLIFDLQKTCVYLAMAYLLVSSSCLFLCNLHSQGSPTVVLVPAWQKLEGYVKDVLAEKMGTSLFFATRTKDNYWAKAASDEYTHIRFIFFQLSWTSLATDIFLWLFVFFFLPWIQTGFEAKAAFVPSRFLHLTTNLPARRHPVFNTMTLKKCTQIYR